MADAKFKCGNCGFEKTVPAQYAGKRVKCPKCQAESRISAVEQAALAASPPSPLVKFNCPICDQKMGVQPQHVGKRVLCPKCKNPVTVPGAAKPAPPPPKAPEVTLQPIQQPQDEDELRLQPLGDAEELLRMERTTGSIAPVAPAPSEPVRRPRDITRGDEPAGTKSRKGLIAFAVIGGVYLVAAILAVIGVLALMAPMPEPEAIDLEPAQKVSEKFIRLFASHKTDDALKLASWDFCRSLRPKDKTMLESFAASGRFEFSEEQHCILEESGKLGVVLTYTDKSSKADQMSAGKETFTAEVNEPGTQEEPAQPEPAQEESSEAITEEVEPNDSQNRKTADTEAENSGKSDNESGEVGRSIVLVLVKGDEGFKVESASTTSSKLEEWISASSELGQKVDMQLLETAFSHLGKRMAAVMVWFIPAGILVFIVVIVSMWIVYSKAGEPGWAAIVPFYNLWVLAEVGDKPGWLGLVVAFSGCIPYVGNLVDIVIMLIISLGVAKTFDRGILFGLGLWLLPFIFFPILAFTD